MNTTSQSALKTSSSQAAHARHLAQGNTGKVANMAAMAMLLRLQAAA